MKEKISEEIKKLQEEAEELSELREGVFNVKADMTVTAVGLLLEKLNDGIESLVVASVEKDNYYDKELCNTLKETTKELVTAFSKIQPPQVKVTPNINVDLNPLKNAFTDISKGQNEIISLLKRVDDGDKSGELTRLITAMIGRQNAIIEKGNNVIDHTPQLKAIADALNNKKGYNGKILKRDNFGRLDTFEITPK